MGIETFLITRPFGLFHDDKIFPVGSLNLIILLTEFIISEIFLLLSSSLLIKLSFIFFDLAFFKSFSLAFKIDK